MAEIVSWPMLLAAAAGIAQRHLMPVLELVVGYMEEVSLVVFLGLCVMIANDSGTTMRLLPIIVIGLTEITIGEASMTRRVMVAP